MMLYSIVGVMSDTSIVAVITNNGNQRNMIYA